MKKMIFGLALLASMNTYAGNGSSGGGHIYGDQLNPWFLVNTQHVNYCIEIAPEFSDLPEERVHGAIREAIAYWKNNFKKYEPYSIPTSDWENSKERLGTQEFIFQSECNSKTDLKFQMGGLTEEQKKEINYKQLIGLAQRTSYDAVNLKGRGFIYIAPENGPLRPSSAQLHKTPWSMQNGQILKYTLFHELGHIFGMQDDHYSNSGLMSAHFVEEITGKDSVLARILYTFREPSPLGCNENFEGFSQMIGGFDSEDEAAELRKYLGLADRFSVYLFSNSTGLRIQDVKTGKIYGEIAYQKIDTLDEEKERAISLYLTKDQKVFKGFERKFLNTRVGLYPLVTRTGLKDETLKLANGNSIKVFVQFDRNCGPSIGGMFKDKLFFNIIFGQ